MRYCLLVISLLLTCISFAEEADDTPEGASFISAGKDYQANLATATDIDFFKFNTVNQEGTLSITLSQETTSIEATQGWQLAVLSEEDLTQTLHTFTLLETELSQQTQFFIPRGRYLLRVSSLDAINAPVQPYTLALTLAITAENNDAVEGADNFSTDRTYRASLYAPTEVDFLLLDSTNKAGDLTITLGHETPEAGNDNPNAGWQLALFAEGNLNQSLQTITLSQAETTTQIQQPITKGKYYLKVSALNELLPTVRYTLKGTLTVTIEDNDRPIGSDRISINGKKTEALYFLGDLDFFNFAIRTDRDDPSRDTSGNLTVTLSQTAPPGANPESGWRLDLYAENDLGNSLHSVELPETSLSVQFEQGLSPGNYYLKISSLGEEAFPSKQYTLESSWEENAYYEKPYNEIPHSATAIQLDETYFGNLSEKTDVDFYRFGLLNADLITAHFTQENQGADSTIGWEVSLFSEQDVGNPIQSIQVPITDLTAVLQANLGIGVYYIRVAAIQLTDEEIDAPVGKPYQILADALNFNQESPCPLATIFAQNPATQRWTAFPSSCEVPPGWNQTAIAPHGIEFCPSPNPTFTSDGLLTLPLVDAYDEENNALGIFAVQLQQVATDPNLRFEVLSNTLLFVKSPQ